VFFNAEIAETAEIVHCAIGTMFTRATTEGTEPLMDADRRR